MKPRIFIAAHYLEIGGAEISLIGLLQAIDYSRYDVDLFVYHHVGELMRLIPKEVNLLPEIPIYAQFEYPLKKTLFSRFWKIGLARLKTKWQYHQFAKTYDCPDNNAYFQFLAENVTPLLPSLNYLGEYDLAINFIGMMNIIRDKVRAKKKITWIHTDYSKISVYPELELPAWSSFDKIVSISDATTDAFVQVFPTLKDKVIVIENILSPTFVRHRAEMGGAEDMIKKDGEICLLSVGRFCTAKNYDNLPFILKGIRDKGVNAKWYIIGYGGDEPLIRQKIEESGMQEYAIILGKKQNPYPYIKACDWYVQPSRYEGKSVTVREAQMLGKAVIVANYTTAKSQVKDRVDGVIVPQENSACSDAMASIITSDMLKSQIEENLCKHDYGNVEEVEKIYKLLNDGISL